LFRAAAADRLRHHIIIHHEAATDVIDNGLTDRKAALFVSTDRLHIVLVDVEDQRHGARPPCELLHAIDEPAAQSMTLSRVQNVELVELRLPRIVGHVPGRETRELGIDLRELEAPIASRKEAREHVERVAAFKHVVDLLCGDDAGIMRAPDDPGEPLHGGQLVMPGGNDRNGGTGHHTR
jgi:hypothetical protein